MKKARSLSLLGCAILALIVSLPAPPAQAVGETSTRFGVFVPPNGSYTSRDPVLIVTAVQDGTAVDIVDDAADGDSDDTVTGLTLNTGQSYILYIQEGAVDDDGPAGGSRKADGDFFLVTASKPIVTANLTLGTDWQHDFVPADNRRMSGTSFYLYRPKGFSDTNAQNELLNIFAYNDHTDIQIVDITNTAKTSSGATSVVSDALGTTVFTCTLDGGQDLQEVNGQKVPLAEGHTYHIVSNKDITVMFGALGKERHASRDGGAYVPGKNGFSADKTFYFAIPYTYEGERELRIVSYERSADVTVRGWNTSATRWDTLATCPLPAHGHAELVGSELGSGYYFFEVTSDAIVSVFETNWLERGSFGTSDIATFISSQDGTGAGDAFLAYLGPPGNQPDGAQLSHLYISSHQTANVQVYDTDSYGEYIELFNNSGGTVNLAGWTLTNAQGRTLILPAGLSVAAGGTVLLEYHEHATNTAADYVYGADYASFRLGNGGDTLTLRNPAATYSDAVSYAASGWGSHGIYRALERVNPNTAFGITNARDSATHHADSYDNLGDFYGTPGVHQGAAGSGGGSVVINELMAGRIYETFAVSADGYHDFSLTVEEWRSLHNGDYPGIRLGPESPYLMVESNAPVSVMNANWNDNWLTYGTGVLLPDPAVNHTADYYQRQAGQAVVFTAYVQNACGALNDPVTRIVIPDGFNYTTGHYSTPSQIGGVTPTETHNADGSWTVAWLHGQPLPAGDVYRFQVWGTIEGGLANDTLLQSIAQTHGTDAAGVPFSSQDSAVVNVGADEPTAVGDVVINEVAPNPQFGSEWIELHNRATSDVNIGGWELADEDGFVYSFPALTFIPNDGYIVVHLAEGSDTATDFYTGAAAAGALHNTEDQVSLYSGSTHDTASLVDFIQWDNDGTFSGPADDDLAVAAGQWSNNTYVATPAAGQSVGRDRNATDNHAAADWDNSGGADAAAPTRGAINVTISGDDFTPPEPVLSLKASPVVSQEGVLVLTWTKPSDGDLAGVQIIRSAERYPTQPGDGDLAYDGLNQTVTDTGLTPGQPYYYTAFAYDDAGNLSWPVASAQTWGIPAQRVHLAYEDLKGAGWVDWDTNDLVVSQNSAVHVSDSGDGSAELAQVGVERIEIVFEIEARGGTYDHDLYLSVEIGGQADVTVARYDAGGGLQSTESETFEDEIDVTIFDSTRTLMPPNHAGGTTNVISGTVPTAGPSTHVTIILDDPSANPPDTAPLPPFDPWIHIANTGADIHLMRAGSVGNSQRVWAAGPLQGRDLPLALDFNQAWDWPLENHTIWDAYPLYPAFITSGHTLNIDWFDFPDAAHIWATYAAGAAAGAMPAAQGRQVTLAGAQSGWPQATGGAVFASPVIVNLDGSGASELIAAAENGHVYVWTAAGAALSGWPKSTGAAVRSSPAVGDIDGDGDNEVIVGNDNNQLYAWHHNGSTVAGFPVTLGGTVKSSPALANLDGDAALEIVVQDGSARVYALNGDGSALPGWPKQTGGVTEAYGNVILASTPAVGDLDADGVPEIVVGATDGRVYAWHADGSSVSTLWPQATGDWVYASPVIVDLNQDGYRDVVAASGDGRIYAWRGDGWPLPGFPARVRGGIIASPAVIDLDGGGDLEIVAATLRGQVVALSADGSSLFGWPQSLGSTIYSSPAVGDLDGDGDQEVIVGAHDGALYAWHDDGYGWHLPGMSWANWPRQTDDWIISSPALGDLDGDGDIEVAIGSFDGRVYVWDESGGWRADAAPWPAFHGGAAHTGVVDTGSFQPLPEVYGLYLPLVSKGQ